MTMNLRAGISLCVMLFVCSGPAAQEKMGQDRILFRGIVFSATTGERLGGSKVYINKFLSGLTRSDGTFSFFAFRHDTIIFNMLGYKASQLIVVDSLKSKEFITGIYLQSDTINIGEVIIIPNLAGLKAEMMNPSRPADQKMDNARANLEIASYQGRANQAKMGDPYSNYDVLRNRQKTDAFEKGGIPSSRIAGVNPLMLLPAAYLLLRGVPGIPPPPVRGLSQKEIDDLNYRYIEIMKNRKPVQDKK